jgi:predicted nucleic acid-binding protein
MKVYADTSFLVQLLTQEAGTKAAVADYRRLGRPRLFLLPLHHLEITNAIQQRVFRQRHTLPSWEHSAIKRERDTSFALLEKYITRRAFIEITHDMETTFELGRRLSAKYADRLGCRGIDTLHVALAIELGCNVFLTADRVQGALAREEGMDDAISVNGSFEVNGVAGQPQ